MSPQQYILIVIAVFVIAILVAAVVQRRPRKDAYVPEHEELLGLQNRWQRPPGLSSSELPRPARYTVTAKVVLLVGLGFLVALVLVGNYLYKSLSSSQQRFQELKKNGVVAQAQITRKWMSRNGKSTGYYATYRFTAGDDVIQRRAVLSPAAYKSLREGDRVPVTYLPFDPMYSRLDIEAAPPGLWLVFLPTAFFLALAALMILPVLAQKKLLQYGLAAPAIVTRAARVKNGVYAEYQFLDAGNNAVRGRGPVQGTPPERREVITVLYDPDKPKRNLIFPPQLVTLATRE